MKIKNTIVVVAGPNGSGKSTLISEAINSLPELYICPDEIVELEEFKHIKSLNDRYAAAMEKAQRLREKAIDKGLSFIFESVFSTEEKLNFLKSAKEKNYHIEAIFITVRDPLISIDRVSQRAQSGGHDVPRDKIIKRYEKCMNMLPEIIKVADIVKVYDNSDETPFIVCFKNHKNKIVLLNKNKRYDWVDKYIVNPLVQSGLLNYKPCDLNTEETDEYIKKYSLSN